VVSALKLTGQLDGPNVLAAQSNQGAHFIITKSEESDFQYVATYELVSEFEIYVKTLTGKTITLGLRM
jgi:hypothetical protein